MKKITLSCHSKSFLTLLFLVLIALSANVNAAAISAAQSGDWSATSTWTGNIVPGASDDVTITGVTVTVSTSGALAKSIIVQSSATVAGKLIVQSGGTLTALTTLNALTLKGGEVENAGTISLTTTDVAAYKYCISYESTGVGMLVTPGKYSGAGSLILDSSTSTSGGGISFGQSADGIFTVGGTYTLSISANRPLFNVGVSGKGVVTGSGTITAGTSGTPAAYGLIIIAGNNAQLTIDPNVVINTYTSISLTKRGPIYFGAASPTTLTNKGTINIEGSGTNAIGSVSSGSNTLINEGVITISGAFTESAIGVNLANTNVLYITNSGTISISGLPTGVTALATPGSQGYFNFTNSTNGVLNINTVSTEISAGTRTRIKNYGGTIKGSGIYNGAFEPSTGTVSPGGDGIGKITIKQLSIFTTVHENTNNLTGKCMMNVNGKNAAGIDFDQIAFLQATVNVAGATLEAVKGSGYSPVLGDNIALFNAVSQTGNFSSTVLPANSTLNYTSPTAISLTFGTTNTELNKNNEVRIYNANRMINIENGLNKQLNIYTIDGKKMFSEKLNTNNKSIEFEKGLYIVEVQNYRKKLIVQ